MQAQRDELIGLLQSAYWKEIETVMSYLAGSINPDGVRAQEIRQTLADEVSDELAHARILGERINELYGVVPGSCDFAAQQPYLQPARDQADLQHVVQGVITAENDAIKGYQRIIGFCEGKDPVTQDVVIGILHDEERHLRLFEGFMREWEPT